MAKSETKTLKTVFPYLLVAFALIALIAAFILTLERIALLKDPSHQPSCSINPVLSCGPIMESPQAAAFGFPNPLIGLVSFGVLITVGMSLLAGAKMKDWYWKTYLVFVTLGMVFVKWLIYSSLYDIGALCIYCMVVWTMVWPIFLYSWLWVKDQTTVFSKKSDKLFGFIRSHHGDLLLLGYLVVITLILIRFWYYWETLI